MAAGQSALLEMLEVVKAAGVDVDGWTRKAATTNYQASPRSNHRGDRRRTAQRNGSPHGPARTRPGSGVADFAAQDGQSAERLDLQTVRMIAATIRTVFAQSDAKPVHSPLTTRHHRRHARPAVPQGKHAPRRGTRPAGFAGFPAQPLKGSAFKRRTDLVGPFPPRSRCCAWPTRFWSRPTDVKTPPPADSYLTAPWRP
jgi:hypothetical protein